MWFIKFELCHNFLLVIEFVCVEFVREFGSEYGHACTFHVDPEIFKEGDVGQHLFFNGLLWFGRREKEQIRCTVCHRLDTLDDLISSRECCGLLPAGIMLLQNNRSFLAAPSADNIIFMRWLLRLPGHHMFKSWAKTNVINSNL